MISDSNSNTLLISNIQTNLGGRLNIYAYVLVHTLLGLFSDSMQYKYTASNKTIMKLAPSIHPIDFSNSSNWCQHFIFNICTFHIPTYYSYIILMSNLRRYCSLHFYSYMIYLVELLIKYFKYTNYHLIIKQKMSRYRSAVN